MRTAANGDHTSKRAPKLICSAEAAANDKARLLIVIASSVLLAVLFCGLFAVILIRPAEAANTEKIVALYAVPLMGCLVGNRWLAKLPQLWKALSMVFPAHDD